MSSTPELALKQPPEASSGAQPASAVSRTQSFAFVAEPADEVETSPMPAPLAGGHAGSKAAKDHGGSTPQPGPQQSLSPGLMRSSPKPFLTEGDVDDMTIASGGASARERIDAEGLVPDEFAMPSTPNPSGTSESGFGDWQQRSAAVSQEISSTKRCTSTDPFWVLTDVRPRADAFGCVGSSALAAAPLRCLDNVLDAADKDYELEVPEAELTTVHIQSWEQRLDWRSFLSEAVASRMARQAYMSCDVEAEPPSYARPPPSAPSIAGPLAAASSQLRPPLPVVAPTGAGFHAVPS